MKRAFLSVPELAAALGCHPHSVLAAIKRKEIFASRIGRRYLVPYSELQRLSNPQLDNKSRAAGAEAEDRA